MDFITIVVIALGLWLGLLAFDVTRWLWSCWLWSQYKRAALSIAIIAINLYVLI